MGGKTRINGTSYAVIGGRTRIGGTAYSIKRGRVKIGSTGYTVNIVPPVVITSVSLPEGGVGEAYYAKLEASGGVGGVYEFSVLSGELPAGLSLSSDGAISGVPEAAGSYTLTFSAQDSDGDTGAWQTEILITES